MAQRQLDAGLARFSIVAVALLATALITGCGNLNSDLVNLSSDQVSPGQDQLQLVGVPSGVSREISIDISAIVSATYEDYAYKITDSTAACAVSTGYQIALRHSPAVVDLTAIADGLVVVCATVIVDGEIKVSEAVSATWVKDTTPPSLLLTIASDIVVANRTTYSLSGMCSENDRVANVSYFLDTDVAQLDFESSVRITTEGAGATNRTCPTDR